MKNQIRRRVSSGQFPRTRNAPGFLRRSQQGVALVIALLLLVVITLVGFAAVRGTIVQQKLASNMYDRQVAFQNAEAALRAAAALVQSTPSLIARDCQTASVTCLTNPFEDPGFKASWVHNVPKGTGLGQYNASAAATGQPQYIVENMGQWQNPSSSTGFGQTANSHNVQSNNNAPSEATYYRITARSGDPAAPDTDNRAIVTLQAMVKQG